MASADTASSVLLSDPRGGLVFRWVDALADGGRAMVDRCAWMRDMGEGGEHGWMDGRVHGQMEGGCGWTCALGCGLSVSNLSLHVIREVQIHCIYCVACDYQGSSSGAVLLPLVRCQWVWTQCTNTVVTAATGLMRLAYVGNISETSRSSQLSFLDADHWLAYNSGRFLVTLAAVIRCGHL